MLPENGRSAQDILTELARLRGDDLAVRGGTVTAYVYDTGRPEVHDVAARAYLEMLEVNTLDPTAFPSIVALERQVVGWVAGTLGGGPHTPGIFTSGGTESIMLAVKAARDTRPVAGRPGVVAPVTAHPAFHKAAHYLGARVVPVDVDPVTFRADPAAVAAAIDADTVLVVASAPSYPQGVVDPVPEIAALAAERGVPCHVDACVGGWLLPWLAEAGAEVPPFDLSVPGVTSLSCDLHKFGYAPKGASVVLFADPALRRAAYFASAAWPGYTVINTGVQSSKSAGPLAGAWATLNALGREGYLALARDALAAARRLVEGIGAIPGLRVLGAPDASLVAFTGENDGGDGVDVFVLADEARRRGWFLQPQLSYAGIPANLHITVTGVTLAGVDALLEVIGASAEAARRRGPARLPDGLAEILATLDLDALDDAAFAELAASVGVDLAGPGGPDMAVVNTVLDALPAANREAILIRFLSVLYG
ncbi:aspartate aminotransferase family protein [Sphaerisporangium siamense]|uniref:Glutamate/tyrosine decarboxylase-like PLP-dependent enzyme n=1 Tax=Sphaerisporangium siamense TaxID=795645 RepID=A0A7W7DCI3_9ACTN|nr:aspartate aminotransferase family protein [Sphaerisporangium siamense]MBB4704292.1 glutamate/tyrosine decarboxylase-like PLP-dependent enzyme [Sphaerisporangium siamense]GII85027.1 aspartate aminotransferase family protein [Sphaerisporangium siamense]